MAVIRLPYGKKYLEAEIPDANLLGVVRPNTGGKRPDEAGLIRAALASPIGAGPLAELARGRDNGVIIISDGTRMAPSARFLPYIVDELDRGGIGPDRVTVVIGLGNHREMTKDEKQSLVGRDLYSRLKCIHSKEAGFKYAGRTSRETPVDVCSIVADADLTVCTGNIEFHRLSGFSGGAKAIMAGVAGKEAIAANHAMANLPGVGPGLIDGNPVREDMEEFACIVGVDFLFNVVTDEVGNIAGAYAGDLVAAHRAGCAKVEELYRITVDRPGDIVVVSPGGFPKDTNVYQAQKGLLNALEICRTGGTVIVAASCPEGYGDEVFARWMEEAESPAEVRDRLDRGFVLGGHKAKTVLQAIEKAGVYWVSEMPEQAVRHLFYEPLATLQEAVDQAFGRHGAGAGVWVMPYGGICLPKLAPTEVTYNGVCAGPLSRALLHYTRKV